VLPSAPTAPAAEWGRFHISRDHASRYFVLYDQRGLVTVTVEKTGTQAVQERLEADARTIGDLQRQVAKLTARFHAQAPPTPQPSFAERLHLQQPWRPPRPLPLIAEDLTAYRITSSRKLVLRWKRNKKVALKPRPCMRTAGHTLLCPSR